MATGLVGNVNSGRYGRRSAVEVRDIETMKAEIGFRAMLRLQSRPRVVNGEFDLRWFRGLQWKRYR
jgi:hypothetical protein